MDGIMVTIPEHGDTTAGGILGTMITGDGVGAATPTAMVTAITLLSVDGVEDTLTTVIQEANLILHLQLPASA